jgi:putative PIN family toxin of toxin-antitoxin system
MLVVLDTNVLVSGLAYPGGSPGRVVRAWRGGAFDVVSSDFALRELARVLPRLSGRTGMSPIQVRDFLDAFRAAASWVEPGADSLAQAQASGLRDPSDVSILAMLTAAGADWLVSGDKALLALADRYPVLTAADFCARHAP